MKFSYKLIKITGNLQNLESKEITKMKKMMEKLVGIKIKIVTVLTDQSGEGSISKAISILSAVVLGSLLLMGLYQLIETTVLPEIQQRIIDMFNFQG